MSALDVLAVMDAEIAVCPQMGCDGTGFVHRADGEAFICNACAELRAARASVAELVAASEVLRAEWDRQDNGQFDAMPAKDFFAAEARWRAALAKFGGGQ